MLGTVTAEWLYTMNEPTKPASTRKHRPVSDDAPSRTAASLSAVAAATRRQDATPTAVDDGEEDVRLRAWVTAMIGRDQRALGSLYDATCARVHGVILRIVRRADLAEEVLADVYHQAWRECHRYDPTRGKVIAWLLIIGRSRALDALRRADDAVSHPSPEDLLAPEALVDSDRDPLGLLDAARGNGMLHAALAALTATQRQLIALAFFKGLSHDEIAAHTRLPLGSVKTHIRKALLQLRDTLADPRDID
ncbi:MAG: sigma-70 family RNA polymerase sigma factor [Burkholderiales bacterium]|nr:sigma-70 family RNA polymerase sigma factor [Burkholderiales bacterium]